MEQQQPPIKPTQTQLTQNIDAKQRINKTLPLIKVKKFKVEEDLDLLMNSFIEFKDKTSKQFKEQKEVTRSMILEQETTTNDLHEAHNTICDKLINHKKASKAFFKEAYQLIDQLKKSTSNLDSEQLLLDQKILLLAETATDYQKRTKKNEEDILELQAKLYEQKVSQEDGEIVQSGTQKPRPISDIEKQINANIEKIQKERTAEQEESKKKFYAELDERLKQQVKILDELIKENKTLVQFINNNPETLSTLEYIKENSEAIKTQSETISTLREQLNEQQKTTSKIIKWFIATASASTVGLLIWLWYYTHK